MQRATRSLWSLSSLKNDSNDALCWSYAERWISHSVDPNELVLELPGGATSLETAVLSTLIDQAKGGWAAVPPGLGFGQDHIQRCFAASVANNDFVFLMWAVLSGNWGNCKASLTYLGKSINMVNSDNTNTKLIEMVRKAWEEKIYIF